MRWLVLLIVFVSVSACQPSAADQPQAKLGIIQFWQPVRGTLTGSEAHLWEFVGQSGDQIRGHVTGQGEPVTLALLGVDGAILSVGDTVEAALPVNGVYTIRVQLAGDGRADYELGLSYTDRPDPAQITSTPLPEVVGIPTPTSPYYAGLGAFMGMIASGETRDGTLTGSVENQVYTFTGSRDTYLTVIMERTGGAIDPLIALYDPQGNILALDDNNGGSRDAALRNIRLFQDGVYTIRVSGGGFPGDYTLRLLAASQPFPVTPTVFAATAIPVTPEILTPSLAPAYDNVALDDHVPALGSLSRPGDFARFLIYAAAGEVITVGVRPAPGSSLKPKLDLVNPGGQLVMTATGSASTGDEALIVAFPVAETADSAYQVYVTGEANTVGAYVVTFGRGATREDIRHGDAAPDVPYQGEMLRGGLRDVWSVYLNADDVITVVAASDVSAFDPVLELVAPDNQVVARDDNGGGGQDSLISAARAPVSGLYHLRVAAVNGAAGTYTLIWRYVNLAPSPTPLPAVVPLMVVDDFVADSAYQFYPFQGLAGQQVRVQVIAHAESSFDPVAVLLAPDGGEITGGDDSQDDLNPRFTADLPVDGTYTVRVTGYAGGGAFELRVEQLVAP